MLKKIIYYFIIFILLIRTFGSIIYVVKADNISPSINPSPTIFISPSISPNILLIKSTPSVSVLPTLTVVPTPMIDNSSSSPTATPTAITDPTDKNNTALINNNLNSNANSGNNSLKINPTATPSSSIIPTFVASNSSSLTTGDAIAVTNVDNTLNSNVSNSQIINQTLNFFFNTSSNIDLSLPLKIATNIINNGNMSPVINVVITSNNTAVLTNNINSSANSGDNAASGSGILNIKTGNTISSVTLVNKVNLTVINSIIHLVTINIFGELNGNIILPNPVVSTPCANCSTNENTANNIASITNNITGSAISGENNINAIGSALLTTGDAVSVINLNNLINSNISGSILGELFINDLGIWNGNFLGWNDLKGQSGGQSLVIFTPSGNSNGISGAIKAQTTHNNALVVNNINSNANSGGNNAIENGDTAIKTGNAYSVICVNNFINSAVVNSFGFFGCINIFGTLNGDIGGANNFLTPTPTPTPESDNNNNTGNNDNGGQSRATACSGATSLNISTSNNTGTYVYPNDTVTFFVNVKNNGNSPANNLKLNLYLELNGGNLGGANYNLPNIGAGETLHITTGFVLANNITPGYYTAEVSVNGNNCDNSSLSGSGYSNFTVNSRINSILGLKNINNSISPKVLGKSFVIKQAVSATCASCIWWPILLIEIGALLIHNSFRVRKKGKNVVFASIPVLIYILFILVNKTCLNLRFGLFPTSGAVYCKYFYLFDAGTVGFYILFLIKLRDRIVKFFSL